MISENTRLVISQTTILGSSDTRALNLGVSMSVSAVHAGLLRFGCSQSLATKEKRGVAWEARYVCIVPGSTG